MVYRIARRLYGSSTIMDCSIKVWNMHTCTFIQGLSLSLERTEPLTEVMPAPGGLIRERGRARAEDIVRILMQYWKMDSGLAFTSL